MSPFVLSDGNQVNNYGFRVNTDGIDLSRFMANPVMLNNHYDGIGGVLGKWMEIKKEGGKLFATPDFDEADENAKQVKGKVDRGYIKGASLGLQY
ncbi:MAG: hypothetical protein LBE82_01770, partial [Chitinophagaceae bacterium]|nr:hypothetical protein [Chitinophagaceae bacterium]